MRLMAGILLVALLAVACGGGGDGSSEGDSSPVTTRAPAPPPTDPTADGTYQTVRQMQLDVESTFYTCNAPIKVYEPPTVEGATAQADCSSVIGLYIFDPADVSAGASALQETNQALVVGANWIISCADDLSRCEKIRDATVGGELITGG